MSINHSLSANSAELATDTCWYAVFTQCHHERRVAQQLEQLAVKCFLPAYEEVSHWKDRIVRLERPLFPSYVFVQVSSKQFKQVLQARGAVNLVGPSRNPTPIPQNEITCLQRAIQNYPTQPADYLKIGERVQIKTGPLRGVTGILLRKTGKCRVVITVDTIMQAFTVEVDGSKLSRLAPDSVQPSRRSIPVA